MAHKRPRTVVLDRMRELYRLCCFEAAWAMYRPMVRAFDESDQGEFRRRRRFLRRFQSREMLMRRRYAEYRGA